MNNTTHKSCLGTSKPAESTLRKFYIKFFTGVTSELISEVKRNIIIAFSPPGAFLVWPVKGSRKIVLNERRHILVYQSISIHNVLLLKITFQYQRWWYRRPGRNIRCFWKKYTCTFFFLKKFSGPFSSRHRILKLVSVDVEELQLLTECGYERLLIETCTMFLNKEDTCLCTAKFLNGFSL